MAGNCSGSFLVALLILPIFGSSAQDPSVDIFVHVRRIHFMT